MYSAPKKLITRDKVSSAFVSFNWHCQTVNTFHPDLRSFKA